MYWMLVFLGGIIFLGIMLIVNGVSKISVNSNVYDENNRWEHHNSQSQEQFRLFNEEMIRQQNEQVNQQFMEESLKSVTPFEMGGHDTTHGNSFNDFNNGMF